MNEKTDNTKNKTMWEFIKFTFFSFGAGIIQIASHALFLEVLKFPDWLAYLIALVLSVVFNFTINRKFTFKQATNVPIAMLKILIYYCIFTPISTWAEYQMTEVWHWNSYVALALCMIANFITEFMVYKFFVFGKKPAATETQEK